MSPSDSRVPAPPFTAPKPFCAETPFRPWPLIVLPGLFTNIFVPTVAVLAKLLMFLKKKMEKSRFKKI